MPVVQSNSSNGGGTNNFSLANEVYIGAAVAQAVESQSAAFQVYRVGLVVQLGETAYYFGQGALKAIRLNGPNAAEWQAFYQGLSDQQQQFVTELLGPPNNFLQWEFGTGIGQQGIVMQPVWLKDP